MGVFGKRAGSRYNHEGLWKSFGKDLKILMTIIAFLLILSLLVFVHELGHFVVAKRAGITVEEFAIGFPPRALKVWQDEGRIILDGHEYIITRQTDVPRAIQPGVQVYAETSTDEKGRPTVTRLELVAVEEAPASNPKKGSEAKFFSIFTPKPKKASPADSRPTVTVDGLTRPTEYTINWIPFGGYVRMVGEEDPSAPGSFASKSKRVRFAVLVAGSLMNLVAAVFFFTLSSMSGVPETAIGTFVTEVVVGTPAAEAGLQPGDLIVGADGQEFKYDGDLINYVEQTKGTEITLHLEREGEIINTSLVPRANPPENQGAMGVAIRYVPLAATIITNVMPGAPAEKAGLQAGDIIISVDEVELKYTDDLLNYLEQVNDAEILLRFERDGKIMTTPLTPLPNSPEGQNKLGAELDYDLDTKTAYYPLQTAFIRGLVQTAEYVGLTFYVPIAILQNIFPAEAARPTGPVGIYQQTGSAVNAAVSFDWWFPVLWFTAVLSTALAVTNLLPLPALDGGRIFFILIEAIRGKRVAPEKEGAIHFIGLALLLTLMLVISYYDLSSPIPPIDWDRLSPK